uniref:CLAVATA3/ESR-related protein n=1 Tax=Globodera virginiae TaxID=304924 RepID=V5R7B6_9BILA|nr:CLAVATA3/ESR-related protein [Globodera virginiae]AHB30311.1 CLAVATA3/ESR-related protein [Globodera virginiae]
MAKNAMLCLLILSVVIALAFATNKNESENHSTGIFGKVGRVVTVALAMSSRLGGAGASRRDGAVNGGKAAVDGLKFNRLPNNNWMAPPPPMPMNGAEVDRSKLSPAEILKKFAQDFRQKNVMHSQRYLGEKTLKQENRVAGGGPDPKHHEDEYLKQENRVVVGGPDPKHHQDENLKQENRVVVGGPDPQHH